MNKLKNLLLIPVLVLTSCAGLTPEQRSALLTTSTNLAHVAAEAAATYYGGPAAGALAGVGLDAVAQIAQAYVGSTIPPEILKATPGVAGVGSAVVAQIAPNHVVNQADVDAIQKAADVAKTLSIVVVRPAQAP